MGLLLPFLLLIASSFALKCHNGSQATSNRFQNQNVPMTEQPCMAFEVCGWAKHPGGEIKMCIPEPMCNQGNIKEFNTTMSLWSCGTNLCNGTEGKQLSLFTSVAVLIVSRIF